MPKKYEKVTQVTDNKGVEHDVDVHVRFAIKTDALGKGKDAELGLVIIHELKRACARAYGTTPLELPSDKIVVLDLDGANRVRSEELIHAQA